MATPIMAIHRLCISMVKDLVEFLQLRATDFRAHFIKEGEYPEGDHVLPQVVSHLEDKSHRCVGDGRTRHVLQLQPHGELMEEEERVCSCMQLHGELSMEVGEREFVAVHNNMET